MIKFFENDPYSPIQYVYQVSDILYSGKSEFQEIRVIENPHFGKILLLDDVVQITERDEFFYHEMLVHVAMHAHPDPRRVVVIGGGDGGAVREVLKHKCVEKVWFVEIDREVINVSRRFFPSVSAGVDDPRVEIRCMDGAEFIKEKAGDVDVIIVDSTDIIGFAKSLFTIDFFKAGKEALTDEGIFVTLSESLHFHREIILSVQETMRLVFPIVDLYTAPLTTYAGNWWSFSIASKKHAPREMKRPFEIGSRYYSDEIHRHAFFPLKLYEKLLKNEFAW